MEKPTHHLFVCGSFRANGTPQGNCAKKNALSLVQHLQEEVDSRDLGGSVAALAILAAWSLLHLRLRAAGIANRLVIQRSTVDYELPIAGAFTARAALAEPARWEPFVKLLQRRGKARIAVLAALEYEGRIAARFSGEFVALTGH